MAATGLASLNERERACLRLVHAGYTTKELARLLEVTDLRASKIIKSAMAKLGVSRRQEAARMLAAYETEGVRNGPGPSRTLPQHPSIITHRQPSEEQGLVVRDTRSRFGNAEAAVDPFSRGSGSVRNELNDRQVLIRLVALIALALLGTGMIIYALGSAADRVAIVPRNSIR